jgi:hypothetical protein
MHTYPWAETSPNQLADNLPDQVSFNDRALVFREAACRQARPPSSSDSAARPSTGRWVGAAYAFGCLSEDAMDRD